MRVNPSVRSIAIVGYLACMAHMAACGTSMNDESSAVAVESLGELTASQVDATLLLGRVWGFVKYHHPAVAGGVHSALDPAPPKAPSFGPNQLSFERMGLDWDAEFARMLPIIATAPDRAAVQRALDTWLHDLGDPAACKPCASLPTELWLRPDLAWLSDTTLLGRALSERLTRLYNNRWNGDRQRYVERSAVGGLTFIESSDSLSMLPSRTGRILGLMRFFAVLEYWYPYRDMIPSGRMTLARSSLQSLWSVDNPTTYALQLMRMTAGARDSHTDVWSAQEIRPPSGSGLLPFTLRWIDGQFVVSSSLNDTVMSKWGIQPGDALLSVDDFDVGTAVDRWSSLIGASNVAVLRRELAKGMRRGRTGPARLVLERAGKRTSVQAERKFSREPNSAEFDHELQGATFRRLSADVVYLRGSEARVSDVASYVEQAAGSTVWVIDLRSYPKDAAALALLARHFVDTTTAYARLAMPILSNPGAFVVSTPEVVEPAGPRYTGRIIVLVDEISQSAAEYATMRFASSPRTFVVGSQTAGADGDVGRLPLPGGHHTLVSGLGVFYHDMRATQQVGVHVDLVRTPTRSGLRERRDEVLEAAVSAVLGRPFRLDSTIRVGPTLHHPAPLECLLTARCE